MELIKTILLVLIASEFSVHSLEFPWLQLSTEDQDFCRACVSGPMVFVLPARGRGVRCRAYPVLQRLELYIHFVLHPQDCGLPFLIGLYNSGNMPHHRPGRLYRSQFGLLHSRKKRNADEMERPAADQASSDLGTWNWESAETEESGGDILHTPPTSQPPMHSEGLFTLLQKAMKYTVDQVQLEKKIGEVVEEVVGSYVDLFRALFY